MSHKSVQHSNRVFRDPGNVSIEALLDAPISQLGDVATITVDDATDFSEKGYVSIDAEIFYYTGKTSTTLTGVTRAVKSTSAASHIISASVIQSRPAPTDATPTTSNLAGWYIDGYTNQASLRVFDSPVIQPGVIRFRPTDGVNPAIFQGCTSVSPTIDWVEFNALQGPQGDPGLINAILTFENVDDPNTNTSNIGEVIKTTTVDVLGNVASNIEVRTIVSGNVSINGIITDTLAITQTSNEIVCSPQPIPLTWNLTNTVSNLKQWDNTNNTAYNWANTAQFPVEAGSEPQAGQVVVSYTSSGNQLCVKPLSFTSTSNLYPFQSTPPYPPDLCIVGICINNPTPSIPAIIATNGIAQISISTTSTPYGLSTSAILPYSGRPCLVNGSGYGINTPNTPIPPYVIIGTFMETTTSLNNGSNAIIKLDPKIITY